MKRHTIYVYNLHASNFVVFIASIMLYGSNCVVFQAHLMPFQRSMIPSLVELFSPVNTVYKPSSVPLMLVKRPAAIAWKSIGCYHGCAIDEADWTQPITATCRPPVWLNSATAQCHTTLSTAGLFMQFIYWQVLHQWIIRTACHCVLK